MVLADLVLIAHVAVVLFVVGGLIAVFMGNALGWAFVNAPAFRLLHLASIAVVVLQAWLGQACFLTTLESDLRVRAGGAAYGPGFIEYWLGRLIYFEAPSWVFTLAYSGFALLVLWAWFRYPPRFRRKGSVQ